MNRWKELQFVNDEEFDEIVKVYEFNDKAHDLNHIHQVIKNAQIICKRMNFEYNLIIEVACLIHDAGANAYNRDNHHKVANQIFEELFNREAIHLFFLDAIEIRNCILEHRSSFKDEDRSSIESRIVAMADSGLPCITNEELIDKLSRSIKYHLSKGESIVEAFNSARLHLKDKYGKNGYLQYSDQYINLFGDMLEVQYRLIDEM